MDKNKTSRNFDYFIYFLALISFLFLVVILATYFYYFYGDVGNQEQFAQFGDFVGGLLNPILSFFTILLLVASLNLQKRELNNVIDEFKMTRDVHKSSVNMRHYEYLIEDLLNENSDMNIAAQHFRATLDEKIVIRPHANEENKFNEQSYTVFQIIADNILFDFVNKYGFLIRQKNSKGEWEEINRDFKDYIDSLRASLETMVKYVRRIEQLGCPRWRAQKLLEIGSDIVEDYFVVSSSRKTSFSDNFELAIPSVNEFKHAFLNYPEEPAEN